jgi:excinuclease UvrABC helicase subunit UvrB
MNDHAQDLEFEEAGRLRDEIRTVKSEFLFMPA